MSSSDYGKNNHWQWEGGGGGEQENIFLNFQASG